MIIACVCVGVARSIVMRHKTISIAYYVVRCLLDDLVRDLWRREWARASALLVEFDDPRFEQAL